MKRQFYKIFCTLFVVCMCVMQISAYAANSTDAVEESKEMCADIEITPHADIIELRTRIHNGVVQHRHWNRTKQCWVEPDWVNS